MSLKETDESIDISNLVGQHDVNVTSEHILDLTKLVDNLEAFSMKSKAATVRNDVEQKQNQPVPESAISSPLGSPTLDEVNLQYDEKKAQKGNLNDLSF